MREGWREGGREGGSEGTRKGMREGGMEGGAKRSSNHCLVDGICSFVGEYACGEA